MKYLFGVKLILFFLILFFQFSACSMFQRNVKVENKVKSVSEENFEKQWNIKYAAIAAELERNRRLWLENKIINYDFVIAKDGPGSTNEWRRLPVLIKIREGEKTSIEGLSKSDSLIYSKTDGFENFDTIDKLFNYLQEELNNGRILEVKYDKKLGYPKGAVIIYSNEIHGYNSIEISKVEFVKPS